MNYRISFLTMIIMAFGAIHCAKPQKESKSSEKPDKKPSSRMAVHTPVKSVKPATAKTVKADPAQKELAFIELSGKVVDRVSPSPFGQNKALPLSKVLRAIKKLGELKNADTLLIQISDFKASLETVWEIRNLLISIGKNEKKRIVVYADSYDLTSYLLGSAAHRIILNPAGEWSVTGLAMESMFMKDFLGSLGITADFLQMGKYKGAAENLTRTSMSPELKESLGRLLDSLYQSFTTILATSRKIKEVDIKALIDKAPLTAQDAVAAHLVDDIQPFHLVFEQYSKGKKIRKPKKKEAKKVSFLSLLSPPKTSTEVDVPHVALILADGSIMYGSEDPNDLFSGDSTIYSKSLVKAINKAADNEKAKAVVLRINSPGGSALASEKIWQALHRCATKKPLIVSMGSYAASGGYYIAAAAHEVFASPFTITGSIGVVGGKMVLGGTLGKLKIRTEILKRGNNAAWMSTSSVFSETERAAIKRTMENVYRLFKDRVRQGRKKVKDVESLAQGRIWSGADAHGNHLVDTMGGLLDATHRARILGKLKGDDPVMIYPRPKPFMAAISEFFDKGTPLDEVSLSLFGNFLPQIHSLLVYKKLLKRERVLLTLPFVLRELY